MLRTRGYPSLWRSSTLDFRLLVFFSSFALLKTAHRTTNLLPFRGKWTIHTHTHTYTVTEGPPSDIYNRLQFNRLSSSSTVITSFRAIRASLIPWSLPSLPCVLRASVPFWRFCKHVFWGKNNICIIVLRFAPCAHSWPGMEDGWKSAALAPLHCIPYRLPGSGKHNVVNNAILKAAYVKWHSIGANFRFYKHAKSVQLRITITKMR